MDKQEYEIKNRELYKFIDKAWDFIYSERASEGWDMLRDAEQKQNELYARLLENKNGL